MIDVVSHASLQGFDGRGLRIRDHFRKRPENAGGKRFCFGPLCVLAETTIDAGCGFDMHRHQDMEIVSYVCEGTLTHQDTLGRGGRLEPGDAQAMTTGTGILHSEWNHGDRPARMYQLWIEPARAGLAPDYVDIADPAAGARGRLHTVVSGRDGTAAPARIHQDATVLAGRLDAGQTVAHAVAAGRRVYVLAAAGRVAVNGVAVSHRDGAAVTDVESVTIQAVDDAEILLIDLP